MVNKAPTLFPEPDTDPFSDIAEPMEDDIKIGSPEPTKETTETDSGVLCYFCNKTFPSAEISTHISTSHGLAEDDVFLGVVENVEVESTEPEPPKDAIKKESAKKQSGDVKKAVKCYFCKELFLSHTIKEHIMTVHGQVKGKALNQCYICGDTFKYLKEVVKHVKTKHKQPATDMHGPTRPFQCHVCKATFTTDKTKANHLCQKKEDVFKEADGRFLCPMCDSRFGAFWTLRRHYETFHADDNKAKNKQDVQ